MVKLEGLGEPVIIIDLIKAAVPDAEIVENITARKNIPLSEVNTRKARAALSISIRLEEPYQFLYVMSRLYEPPDAANTRDIKLYRVCCQ